MVYHANTILNQLTGLFGGQGFEHSAKTDYRGQNKRAIDPAP